MPHDDCTKISLKLVAFPTLRLPPRNHSSAWPWPERRERCVEYAGGAPVVIELRDDGEMLAQLNDGHAFAPVAVKPGHSA